MRCRASVLASEPRATGHIVNMSSAVGKVPGARAATYCATKFGVAGFSEAVALELHGTGVEISVIFPPQCNTEMTSGMKVMRGMPLVQPDDVAARILEALERPQFEVPVPQSLGRTLRLNQALPFRARAALARITKADLLIRDIDAAKRTAYDQRLERMTTPRHEAKVELASVPATGEE